MSAMSLMPSTSLISTCFLEAEKKYQGIKYIEHHQRVVRRLKRALCNNHVYFRFLFEHKFAWQM
jgi:hypothetical protein